MDTRLLAELEQAIDKWINDNCEKEYWPYTWLYDDQCKDMANAAATVFDASCKGQAFAKEQEA